jgi:nitroreductase
MEFLELVLKRQSVRKYDPLKPVEPQKVNRCIEALRMAPSACNAQPWKLVVVTDPVLKDQVAEAAVSGILGMNPFIKQAPVLVVLVREEPNLTSRLGTAIKNKPYTVMDVGIAAAHFCLAATAEGLGTCMMGWFEETKVKKLLGIPRFKRAELIIAVGYAASEEIRPKKRKPKEEICSYNKY